LCLLVLLSLIVFFVTKLFGFSLNRIFIPKSIAYVLLLIAIAAWGPFMRSSLDKLWMASGGLVSIGHWAQFQTLIDFMVAPIVSGIAVGVSILTAQKKGSDRFNLLLGGYYLSALTILPLLILILIFSEKISQWMGFDGNYQLEIILCAIAGYLNLASAILNGVFIGQNKQGKSLILMVCNGLPIILTLAVCNHYQLANPITLVLYCLIYIGLCNNLLLISLLYRTSRYQHPSHIQLIEWGRSLAGFIPAGLAIGIFSPLCVLLARSLIANQQNWEVAGQATAVWRASDWILSGVVTILYFHFLPLLSRDAVKGKLNDTIWRITRQIMFPSIVALLALVVLRNSVLQLLYSDQIHLSLDTALYFWLGEAARILSAIFLMGLFILHATKLITLSDLFSQPLFVTLLFFGMGASLSLTGLAYFLTYLLYSALCILGFMWIEGKNRIAQQSSY